MTQNSNQPLSGAILEEELELSLTELTRACRVNADFVVELVDEGIIEPVDPRQPRWRFSGQSLVRLRRAVNLHRDLELNLAGVALALDLLTEIETLQARLERLSRERH